MSKATTRHDTPHSEGAGQTHPTTLTVRLSSQAREYPSEPKPPATCSTLSTQAVCGFSTGNALALRRLGRAISRQHHAAQRSGSWCASRGSARQEATHPSPSPALLLETQTCLSFPPPVPLLATRAIAESIEAQRSRKVQKPRGSNVRKRTSGLQGNAEEARGEARETKHGYYC